MRLVMMGTGPFAVPAFRAFYNTRHTIVALVTAPLRTHRGKPVQPISCIRDIATEHSTPILDPEDVNLPEAQTQLATLAADLLVVCDYGQILSAATLSAAGRGGVNLHASLLPRYRGAAPIQWAIYHGETETGVTVIYMTPQLDAGPCIAQMRVAIGPEDTAAELESRLADIGARLLCQTIDAMEAGDLQPIPQDSALASKAPRLKKTDGLIDWSRPALAIKNHIRAMEPWPKTYTFWQRAGVEPLRLILGPATVVDCPANLAPGTVAEASSRRLVIAAGQSAVAPQTIQPAGKRVMTVEEFLRGHPIRPGHQFGAETNPQPLTPDPFPMLDLDIGVIYTHERDLMSPLVESMRASGAGLRMRLILVDNNSSDGVEPWSCAFDETKILYNQQRATYAVNLNRVLAASSARYVLLLNTDMRFDPAEQCLAKMVAFMDANPRCGIAGCRLYHADGAGAHAARRFPTVPLILARRCGLGTLLRRSVDRHFYAEHRPDETWQCDWLSGCFLMVRRSAYEEIGGLDEGYGKYLEDVDFCLRMALAGWLVMYHGATSCCHLEQRASRRFLSADACRHLRSYIRFVCKWGWRPGASHSH